MTISSINANPKSYKPKQEKAPVIESFYKNEYMTLTFGEYVGRPSDFIDFHKSDLVYFLSDGWKVDGVLANGEGGKWTVEARSLSSQAGHSSQSSRSSSSSSSQSTDSDSQSSTTSSGTSQSSSSGGSAGVGAAANTQEGGPYWFAWSKIRLVRKRLQGDKVTDYLMERLTACYNEGRKLNSDRYDEICRLYAAMVDSTQGVARNATFPYFYSARMDELEKDVILRMRNLALPSVEEIEDISSRVDARVSQWLAAREKEINRQFDARIGQSKSQMVSNGTYNSVVWPSVLAGIERERQNSLSTLASALGELESSVAQIKEGAFTQKMNRVKIAQEIESSVSEISLRLRESAAKVTREVVAGEIDLTQMRNNAVAALAKFMEAREDDYPDIETILEVVTRLDNQSVDPGGGLSGGAVGSNKQTILPDPTLPKLPSIPSHVPGVPDSGE